jgi:hypothetical protein
MTMIKRTNPLHAQALPLPGQQLPADWKASTNAHGGTFDRRPLEELWKLPMNTKTPVDSITRNARLQPPSWDELYGQK